MLSLDRTTISKGLNELKKKKLGSKGHSHVLESQDTWRRALGQAFFGSVLFCFSFMLINHMSLDRGARLADIVLQC